MNQKQAQNQANKRVDKLVLRQLKTIGDKLDTVDKVAQSEAAKIYGRLSDIIAYNAENPDKQKNLKAEADRRGLTAPMKANIINAYTDAGINTEIIDTSKKAYANQYYLSMFALLFFAGRNFTANPDEGKLLVSVYGQLTPKEVAKAIKGRDLSKLSAYIARNGIELSEYLRDTVTPQELQKIIGEIESGLSSGRSLQQTARELKKQIDSTYNRMIRIVRTESHRVRQLAEYNVYQDATQKGIQVERVLISVIDGRERDQSAEMNGQVANENDMFVYPDGSTAITPGNTGNPAYDINDREGVINRLTDMPDNAIIGKNPVTGERERVSYRDYPEWLQRTTQEARAMRKLTQ